MPRNRSSSVSRVPRPLPNSHLWPDRSSHPPNRRAKGFVFEKQRGVVGTQMAPFEVEPTVDQQRLAGDVARQVGEQEKDGAGLFPGPPAPTHRDRLPIPVLVLVDVGA